MALVAPGHLTHLGMDTSQSSMGPSAYFLLPWGEQKNGFCHSEALRHLAIFSPGIQPVLNNYLAPGLFLPIFPSRGAV